LFINAADICLVTLRDIPLFEGAIPTKLIDYMACGKAVLCGIHGEAERIVNDARSGAIFGPDNHEQLASLVLELLSDKNRVDKMGANGLAYVQKRFSAELMRQQMESILLSIVNNTLVFPTVESPKW